MDGAEALIEGATVDVCGSVIVTFGELEGNLRDAPTRSLSMRARLLSVGQGADAIMADAIDGLDRRRPETHGDWDGITDSDRPAAYGQKK